jgi:hypothetical protein
MEELICSEKKHELFTKTCPKKSSELENIILSEACQVQKAKGPMFSLVCGIQTTYDYTNNIMKNMSH